MYLLLGGRGHDRMWSHRTFGSHLKYSFHPSRASYDSYIKPSCKLVCNTLPYLNIQLICDYFH